MCTFYNCFYKSYYLNKFFKNQSISSARIMKWKLLNANIISKRHDYLSQTLFNKFDTSSIYSIWNKELSSWFWDTDAAPNRRNYNKHFPFCRKASGKWIIKYNLETISLVLLRKTPSCSLLHPQWGFLAKGSQKVYTCISIPCFSSLCNIFFK